MGFHVFVVVVVACGGEGAGRATAPQAWWLVSEPGGTCDRLGFALARNQFPRLCFCPYAADFVPCSVSTEEASSAVAAAEMMSEKNECYQS